MAVSFKSADQHTRSLEIREDFSIFISIPDQPEDVSAAGGCDGVSHCDHSFLDKYGDEYVCKNCRYALQPTVDEDAVRITNELELEANTPSDVIPDGLTVGKMSQMRGVKIGFLLQFTRKFNCWKWTACDVINKIIMPFTCTRRCRFVELDWMAEHVGPAKTFISYAQQGTWGDLVAAILDGGADLERTVWIDIFAVRQWPCNTPDLDFANTIDHCDSFLCVCSYIESVDKMEFKKAAARKTELIPATDRKKIAFLRVWCLVEIAAAAKKINMPRVMKCGTYKFNDDGSVEFESKSDLLGHLSFLIDINKAEATVESDRSRILSDIQDTLSIEGLNRVIRGVLSGAMSLADLGNVGSTVQCAACGDPKAVQNISLDLSKSFHAIVAGGYVDLLEKLPASWKEHVNVTEDNKGMTALMLASLGGHERIVEMLLINGANVHVKDKFGSTSLVIASQHGHERVMEMLLVHGADVHSKSNMGNTSLMLASHAGHERALEKLLAHGADVHAKSIYDVTSLIYASQTGHERVVEMLLVHGADVNAKDKFGGTSLMKACQHGHERVVEMLLVHGADVNAKSNDGWTSLIVASNTGHERVVEILKRHGATC